MRKLLKNILYVVVIMLLSIIPVFISNADDIIDTLNGCSKIDDSLKRLICYDDAVKSINNIKLQNEEEKKEQWQVVKSKSKIDDSEIITMTLHANKNVKMPDGTFKKPYIQILYQGNEVFFGACFLDIISFTLDELEVTSRLDSENAITTPWLISSKHTFCMSKNPSKFIKSLFGHDKLILQAKTLNYLRLLEFDISGIEQDLEPIRKVFNFDSENEKDVSAAQNDEKNNWYIKIDKSKIDDSDKVFMSLDSKELVHDQWGNAKRPSLCIRCSDNKTELYVTWDLNFGFNNDEIKVTERIDSNKAKIIMWDVSTNYKTLFRRKPIEFIKSLYGHNKLVLQTEPHDVGPQLVEFDITDIENTIEPVRKACHWNDDLSKKEHLSGDAPKDTPKQLGKDTTKSQLKTSSMGNKKSEGKAQTKLDNSNDTSSISKLYSELIIKEIQSNLSVPITSTNLATKIRITFDKAGRVLDYRIEKSSGRIEYDTSVMNAVRRSAHTLPPPPISKLQHIVITINSRRLQ